VAALAQVDKAEQVTLVLIAQQAAELAEFGTIPHPAVPEGLVVEVAIRLQTVVDLEYQAALV
jgi:hypothetical protein